MNVFVLAGSQDSGPHLHVCVQFPGAADVGQGRQGRRRDAHASCAQTLQVNN